MSSVNIPWDGMVVAPSLTLCGIRAGNGEVKMITFSGELMWTAQLRGGGVLCLDLRASYGCAKSSLHAAVQ